MLLLVRGRILAKSTHETDCLASCFLCFVNLRGSPCLCPNSVGSWRAAAVRHRKTGPSWLGCFLPKHPLSRLWRLMVRRLATCPCQQISPVFGRKQEDLCHSRPRLCGCECQADAQRREVYRYSIGSGKTSACRRRRNRFKGRTSGSHKRKSGIFWQLRVHFGSRRCARNP